MTETPGAPPVELAPVDEYPDLSGPDSRTAFGLLFDRNARPLHRYLARRVGEQAADDLVAEVFLTAWAQRTRYDPRRASARSWLYGIATNLLRRHVRQEVRHLRAAARMSNRTAAEQAESHDGRVAERVDAAMRARQLAGALAELAPADRDVLLLVSWAGLDTTEVAEALGIPVGTVRSRLHRIRRGLRAGHRAARTEDGHA